MTQRLTHVVICHHLLAILGLYLKYILPQSFQISVFNLKKQQQKNHQNIYAIVTAG